MRFCNRLAKFGNTLVYPCKRSSGLLRLSGVRVHTRGERPQLCEHSASVDEVLLHADSFAFARVSTRQCASGNVIFGSSLFGCNTDNAREMKNDSGRGLSPWSLARRGVPPPRREERLDYFVRISASLLHSAVWVQQPAHVRLVWVAMLLAADEQGRLVSSHAGLAHLAGVSVDECEDALQVFTSPDAQAKDREGLKEIEGGWAILNPSKYRQRQTIAQQAAAARQRAYAKRREEAIQRELAGGRAEGDGAASFWPPAGFTPSEKHCSKAQSLGLNMREVVEAFVATRFDTPRMVWGRTFTAFLDTYAQRHPKAKPRVERVSTDTDLTRPNAEGDQVLGPKRVIVPDDWSPKEAHEVRAQEMGLDMADEVERFRVFEFGRPVADWDKRFSRWLIDSRNRRATERARERERAIAGAGPVRARPQPDHGVTGFERLEGGR